MSTTGFGVSRQGPDREVNEDTIFVDQDVGIYIVADGLGGQPAGELASRLAVDVVTGFMQRTRNSLEITWPYGIDDQQSLNGNRLLTAVRLANRRLWKHADQHEEHIGMGTTIVAAIVEDDRLTVCSAGDSRAYLLRNGDMRQLTTDDSWAQMALAAGIIDEEKVSKHPMRNMITAAVGATESIQAQILEESLQPRDVCLLCSDGLHKLLSDEEMRAAIEASAGNLEDATEALARAAEVAGIDDDVSAVLLRYDTNT